MKLLVQKSVFITFLFFAIICTKAHSTSINVSGSIYSNTIWNADTVKVIGDVFIYDSLTIAPGTRVEMHGFYQIINYNKLKAIGNINDSIYFYSYDTTNFFDSNIAAGGWIGIKNDLQPTTSSTATLSFCSIKHMKYHHGSYFTKIFGLWLYTDGTITHCTITENNLWNNNTYSPSFPYAGGSLISAYGSVLLQFNKISNNKCGGCGTITCYGNTISNYTQIIDQNTIAYNTNTNKAGAILCNNSSVIITNNFICNNSAINDAACGFTCGGGAIFLEQSSSPYIANNVIANNYSAEAGGAIKSLSSSAYIINNDIVNNWANSDYWLSGCHGGGGIYFHNSTKSPIIKNNIIYGNKVKTISEQIKSDGTQNQPEIYNSAIEGGFGGFGFYPPLIAYTNPNVYPGIYLNNISSNPLFNNPSSGAGVSFDGLGSADWRLQSSSPCINTGTLNNLGNLPNIDLWYNPRIVGTSIEMGAYEAPTGSPDGINDYNNNSLISIYPNPATNNFSINYSLNYDKAAISMVNALGQIVETKQFNNSEKMNFDVSSFAKGIYFVNALIDENSISSKLIIE